MNIYLSILVWFFLILEAALWLPVGYLLVLTLAARFARPQITLPARPETQFAILVPAHNEERLLPELLSSLAAQDYPTALYTVFVVADNCSDHTAEIARAAGAQVFERSDTRQVGKGYALNWLLEQIHRASPNKSAGAFIIFDADTIIDPHFLKGMDGHLQRGDSAIQGYYAVRNPTRSWGVALRYAALAVLHYLRPLGRSTLGGTAGLKGNGMCFRASLYEKNRWSGSLTEDIEYHTALVLAGERVAFAPEAVLQAEMPERLSAAQTQNARWERGRLEMARKSVPGLLKQAIEHRRFAALDAAMEHLIPPMAALTGLVVICLMAGIGLACAGAWLPFWGALALLAGIVVYLAFGLILVRAPGKVWLALLYAPIYMIWKSVLLLKIALNRRPQKWVRTER